MAATVHQAAPAETCQPCMAEAEARKMSRGSRTSSEIVHRLPTEAELAAAADTPVYGIAGESRPFKSFCALGSEKKRHLVIFIRHFFCGMCQDFIRNLVKDVTPAFLASLPVPTTLSLIGCGSPDLIPNYVSYTKCPFPIYTDPSRKLHELFGLTSSLNLGGARPEYQTSSLSTIVGRSFWQGLSSGTGAVKGGNFSQLGGEILFANGEAIWCHRMGNTRDHTTVAELKDVLTQL